MAVAPGEAILEWGQEEEERSHVSVPGLLFLNHPGEIGKGRLLNMPFFTAFPPQAAPVLNQ